MRRVLDGNSQMTTIAIRNGIVAADSRIKDGEVISPSRINKVRYSKKLGAIITFCGTLSSASSAVRKLEKLGLPWRKEWNKKDTLGLDEETEIIVLDSDGTVYEFCGDDNWITTDGEFFAYGSGTVAAVSAMHAGASAERAVQIACLVDPGSGLPVHAIDIADF